MKTRKGRGRGRGREILKRKGLQDEGEGEDGGSGEGRGEELQEEVKQCVARSLKWKQNARPPNGGNGGKVKLKGPG